MAPSTYRLARKLNRDVARREGKGFLASVAHPLTIFLPRGSTRHRRRERYGEEDSSNLRHGVRADAAGETRREA